MPVKAIIFDNMPIMNYHQVFSYFNLKPVFETSFCINYQYKNKIFALYRAYGTGNITCLFLNKLTNNTPKEVFLILSDSIIYKDINSLGMKPELGTKLDLIQEDKLINFLYGFVPLREVVWDENAAGIFADDCFENIFSNAKNMDLSIILTDEKERICDVIDFNNTYFHSRFDNDRGIWKSKYFSNMKESVLCFNPYCLVNFYNNNNAIDYFSIVVSSNQNIHIQSKVYEILMKYPFNCYNILYAPNTNELFSILDLIVFYGKFHWGVDVFVKRNPDSFTLSFSFGLEANLIQYIQFTSNVQSHYRKLLGTTMEEIDNILKCYSMKITNTIIEDRKIYSLECPDKVECYEAALQNLLKLMNKTTLFNLISCK